MLKTYVYCIYCDANAKDIKKGAPPFHNAFDETSPGNPGEFRHIIGICMSCKEKEIADDKLLFRVRAHEETQSRQSMIPSSHH